MSQNGNTSPSVVQDDCEETSSKVCNIVKRPDFEGYGFNLHSEKSKPGQYIGKVDLNSPAEIGGLKEGDRIIAVNGVEIGNETHKQVVQRIKAISCEVRLLLIDADGIENTTKSERKSTIQEIPGSSANISTISMTTTKRTSNACGNSTNSSSTNVTDKALPSSQNGMLSKTPPRDQSADNNHNKSNINNSTNIKAPPPPSTAVATPPPAPLNGRNKVGLELPTTAAEMRAKLLSKKKYDPKNESVDLKKKFEIIEKL